MKATTGTGGPKGSVDTAFHGSEVENVAPAASDQPKLGEADAASTNADAEHRAACGALSDITNGRNMQRKGTETASDFVQGVQELPGSAPDVAQNAVGASAGAWDRPAFEHDHARTAMLENGREDLWCAEYAPDIAATLFTEERAQMPGVMFTDAQRLNPHMHAARGDLVDHLQEVSLDHDLRIESLHLAVNIVDRYMALHQVTPRRLKFLGLVALYIAVKYHEPTNRLSAEELAGWTKTGYTRDAIIAFEVVVWNELGWHLEVATPVSFFGQFARANGCGPRQEALVSDLLALSLTEMQMTRHLPSQLVSAAILLSNDLLRKQPLWSAAVVRCSRRPAAVLLPIAAELRELLQRSPSSHWQAARREYLSNENYNVAVHRSVP